MLLSLVTEVMDEVEQAFAQLAEATLKLHGCDTVEALLQTGVQQTQALFGGDRVLIGQPAAP